MLDWLSNLLGNLSNAPFVKPFTALIFGFAGAFIAYLNSDHWGALFVLCVASIICLLVFAKSLQGPIAAFSLSVATMGIASNLDSILKLITDTPTECGVHLEEGETREQCYERTLNDGLQKLSPDAPEINLE